MKEKRTFKRMLSLYKPHKPMVCLIMFGVLLNTGLELAWPILTKIVLNNCLGKSFAEAYPTMMKCLVGLVAVTLLSVFTDWILSERASVLTDRIKYDLQQRIFHKYMYMSYTYFDNSRSGSMITLLDYDVSKVDEFIYTLMTSVATIIFNTIGALILFSSLSIKITVMILPLIAGIFIFNNWHGKFLTDAFKEMREKDKLRMEEAEDKFAGVRTVVSFGKEQEESNRFYALSKDIAEESKRAWKHTWIRNSGGSIFKGSIDIVILIIGGFMTIQGSLPISDLTICLMYSGLLTTPVNTIVNVLKLYNKAHASFEHILHHLDMESEITDPKNAFNSDIAGEIAFDHCSFKYETSNEMILKDFNLHIEAGTSVAIVGPSGSGKSTIAGLIPRYYDVTEGNIRIDGINVKDFELRKLRRSIGVVQQDIYLFFGTIYDNIAYSCPWASMKDVIMAAKMANAHEFISELPNGYHTNIGDRGVKLSGGQKQRIAIARVFLENPPIIIFDEATSALDNASEKEVQKAMDNVSRIRTTVTIAHRLTTVKHADEIIFLTKNGIEERGTHDELMELNGKYAALYRSSDAADDE